jgi:hypothetical protein
LEIYSTVSLQTAGASLYGQQPRAAALNYAITLPSVQNFPARNLNGATEETIEIDHDLSGVEAVWEPSSANSNLTIWLPHLDLGVSRRFTFESASHKDFWASVSRSGKLGLRTQLDLWHMLKPDIQPVQNWISNIRPKKFL